MLNGESTGLSYSLSCCLLRIIPGSGALFCSSVRNRIHHQTKVQVEIRGFHPAQTVGSDRESFAGAVESDVPDVA